MLLNKFYTIDHQSSEDGNVLALISFDRSHPIFSGHFPGHPVVPGVCMMQVLREVMELELGKKLRISSAENMKFLNVINPDVNSTVEVIIAYKAAENTFALNASIQFNGFVFFKFKGTFHVS